MQHFYKQSMFTELNIDEQVMLLGKNGNKPYLIRYQIVKAGYSKITATTIVSSTAEAVKWSFDFYNHELSNHTCSDKCLKNIVAWASSNWRFIQFTVTDKAEENVQINGDIN